MPHGSRTSLSIHFFRVLGRAGHRAFDVVTGGSSTGRPGWVAGDSRVGEAGFHKGGDGVKLVLSRSSAAKRGEMSSGVVSRSWQEKTASKV